MNDVKAYEIYSENGSYTHVIAKDRECLKDIMEKRFYGEEYKAREVSLDHVHLSSLTAGDLLRLLK